MSKLNILSQIINLVDEKFLRKRIREHKCDKYSKGFGSRPHLISMIFCHLSKANSLREISNGLKSLTGNLSHVGMKKAPSKSTLSDANKTRNWQFFKDCYFDLYTHLNSISQFSRFKLKGISKKIFLLDSTTITLSLSMYDWAKYKTKKGAIKLHTLLNYDGCLPTFVDMTDGKVADPTIAKCLVLPKDSVVVADRAYQDFNNLYRWNENEVQFVVRMKDNILYERVDENDLPDDCSENILIDEIIQLSGQQTSKDYPQRLRRVCVYSEEHNTAIEIVTNNFSWTAQMISDIYKQRWMIEIFFKEIKQHLKIKSFIGTSENAVLIQVWTALISILVLKFLKSKAKYSWCLSNLVAFLRMNLFVKIDLQQWLDEPFKPEPIEENPQLAFL